MKPRIFWECRKKPSFATGGWRRRGCYAGYPRMGAVQSERWQKIKDLHDAAIPLSRGDREALLDEACRNDSELRREVESLLAYENRAAHFMESPAYQVVAAELGRDEAEVGSSAGGTLVGQNVSHYHII